MSSAAMVSAILHGALVALAIFPLGFRSREPILMGGDGSGGRAVAVSLTPSIPLPAAPVENPLATDTKSENLPEPEKKTKTVEPILPPKPNDYLVKDTKKSKQERLEEAKRQLIADATKDMHRPSNAVPGSGGRASSQMYGMTAPSAGSGGIGFGGDFDSRYSFYVRSVQTCLTTQWQQMRPSESLQTNAAKAYVTFEILKDGTIVNEHISRTSGFPSEDRDAVATVVGCSGRNGGPHLPALPRDFEASRVPVEVWFATKQ
jgi:outer membrane biosynthesis protein TonB